MTRMIGLAALAVLALAARPVSAQSQSPLPGSSNTQTTPQTTPGSATTSAAGANDPTTVDTFNQLRSINARLIHVGNMGAEKGSTPNVKEFGRRLVEEHQRLDRELAQMAQQRGIQLQAPETYTSEPGHVNFWQPILAKTGLEFDRAYMDAVVDEREKRSEHLKQLRDRTPGKDAELKKWTDTMQDLMEKTRNESRDVRQAVRQAQSQQRQGRTP